MAIKTTELVALAFGLLRAWRRWSICTAGIAVALTSGIVRGQSPPRQISERGRQQMTALLEQKASWTPVQWKIGSNLIFARKIHLGQPVARGIATLRTGIEIDPSGRTLVDLKAAVTPALLREISALGGTVMSSFPQYQAIRARIPIAQVEAIAALQGVKSLRPAARAFTRKINTSEGDVAHGADVARSAFGLDGTGVRIGVISDSVDSLGTVQATGDLPPVVTFPPAESGLNLCGSPLGSVPCSGEGTAMLEIVFDLAPGAALFFETGFRSPASFAANIIDLRNTFACDVIVDDIGWSDEPAFEPGVIEQAVNTVVASGAVYFSSAGNNGNLNDGTSGVWEGDYLSSGIDIGSPTDGNPDIAHDFGGGSIFNQITADTPQDLFSLQWSDAFGASANDYDLWLFDPTGTTILAQSITAQRGTQDPLETIFSPGFNDTGNLLVVTKSLSPGRTPQDRFLRLNAHGGVLLVNTAGQTWGHPTAVGGIGVAAVDWFFAGGSGGNFDGSESVETFSSDGPRRAFFDAAGNPLTPGDFSSTGGVLRQKPDLTGADGVSTATPTTDAAGNLLFNPFFGTSAAAPHVAAIAALLLEADPSLTPMGMRVALTSTAIDIEAPGPDRDSGFGIVDARAAVAAVLPPRAIFLLDRSGSMSEIESGTRATGYSRCKDSWDGAVADMASFFSDHPSGEAAVMSFGAFFGGVRTHTTGFVSRTPAETALGLLDPVTTEDCAGRSFNLTPLAEALCEAINLLPPGDILELHITSDGGENDSDPPCDGDTNPTTGPDFSDKSYWQGKVLNALNAHPTPPQVSVRFWEGESPFPRGEALPEGADVGSAAAAGRAAVQATVESDRAFFEVLAAQTGGEFTLHHDDDPVSPFAIPTVSTWGLAVLSLALMSGARAYFGRQRRAKTAA